MLAPLVLALLLPPGAALSGQEIGDETGAGEGALFLLLPVGAHGVGLGRAMTALESEEAAFWNPAGLARQTSRRVMVYRGNQIAGDATAINVLLPWKRVGTFGVSYLLLDIGDQVLRDDFGDRLGRISVRNHAGILSYAASFPGRIDAGINMKLVQFRISCRGQCPDFATTSSAYAIDAGIQAEPFRRIPLRFGWMIAHAGTEFQVFNEAQSDPLPTRIRFRGRIRFAPPARIRGSGALGNSGDGRPRPRSGLAVALHGLEPVRRRPVLRACRATWEASWTRPTGQRSGWESASTVSTSISQSP